LEIKGNAPTEESGTAAALNKSITDAVASIDKSMVAIACARGVGAQMGVITNANKVYIDGEAAEGSCSVEHKEGQVLLLDFWATWCPPCQAPMGHNQKMLEERGKDWGDKVRLIGLSIDNDVGTVKSHVESKKWTSVEHYHVRTAGCTADKEYGVKGVPHVLLVDTKGKIVFMGHPANREIEKDIDALLKGETLTGAGTGAAAKAESEGESSGASPSASEAEAAIAKFKTESKEFNENSKDTCSKLPRAFLVLVDEASYDC
jgi:thiol-disulfide isomerase/thioredoxin